MSAVAARLPGSTTRGADVPIDDVSHDSSFRGSSWLFCAVPGARADGHDHVGSATDNGAVAALVERWVDLPIPQVMVPSVRAAIGPAASHVHGHPSGALSVLGVTGTNGKTTVTFLMEAALRAAGHRVGVIGTVGSGVERHLTVQARTTPEAADLQRALRAMADEGVDAVAMEVSSHGLDMHRVDGTRFAVAVFTNLTRDHLDWHGSMDAYLRAKARLFTPELAERGVVDLDAPGARDLLALARIPVTTIGTGDEADVRLSDVRVDGRGGRAVLTDDRRSIAFSTRLIGRFNVTNAALALVAAWTVGGDADVLRDGIATASAPPGRMARVEVEGMAPGTGPEVIVDYAHTPDAITVVIAAVREVVDVATRVCVVVGAGGDRDQGKRRPMGRAAARADVVVLTDDNPRGEDPVAIVRELTAGVTEAVDIDGCRPLVHVEHDRARAIAWALTTMAPGDVVVIAGKGHETGQELAGTITPFDDREVAAAVLASMVSS